MSWVVRVIYYLRANKRFGLSAKYDLERVMGIEPTLFAWEARVLPLNDTRVRHYCGAIILEFQPSALGRLELSWRNSNQYFCGSSVMLLAAKVRGGVCPRPNPA